MPTIALSVLALPLLALAALATPGTTVTTVTTGDTLLIERARQSDATLPRRGASMAEVEARFGAPVEKFPSVGGGSARTPPITRWLYAGFSVYFEHRHVVDAVLHKAGPDEIGPAPAVR